MTCKLLLIFQDEALSDLSHVTSLHFIPYFFQIFLGSLDSVLPEEEHRALNVLPSYLLLVANDGAFRVKSPCCLWYAVKMLLSV